ncbi:hypothetical protein F4561_004833 [Lipingzhangella halophila]|uniref:LPXTG-motif cell wall-anchored protein n=1 Tax=Lipingzhangella halophila TaxID=1783352 RepID=A0A7W7RLZ4_9ACTN|nr:hypothetical protein [Lipingzhangella halophila]MBB4934013.1 hypothetical protein [Lipingzhangella halophila]
MKRPLSGVTAAGLVSIAVASGTAAVYAADGRERPEPARNAAEDGVTTDSLDDSLAGYGVYSYQPAEDEDNAQSGADGQPGASDDEPAGSKGSQESGETTAAERPHAPPDTGTQDDAAPGERTAPEADPGERPGTGSAVAQTLPVTGGPPTVLAALGAAALTTGAALLGLARRLRYQPRH